jgi:hypothetical protein
MSKQKYTLEDVTLWAEYRDIDGMSYPEIEVMLSLPKGVCAYYIKQFGLTTRKNNREYDRGAIAAMYLDGAKIEDICMAAGIKSSRTVYMVLRDMGISIRRSKVAD